MIRKFSTLVALMMLAFSGISLAQDVASMDADVAQVEARDMEAREAESREQFRSLDQDVQSLKKEVLDLNRDLFLLE
ncbi:MAG: hypothetical protein OEU59_09730, partial [Gammaproteobacteria bacterium]|nr:hypothetical protein [Gammaproteobacteria bacterium]